MDPSLVFVPLLRPVVATLFCLHQWLSEAESVFPYRTLFYATWTQRTITLLPVLFGLALIISPQRLTDGFEERDLER
ncbi:MAG: hypothetical protein J3Q66DRAFT_332230 [Benniella sp.]|nr:MAG: hypothetical protein J3Q66DRAFT_332230 [Benniella sp.]